VAGSYRGGALTDEPSLGVRAPEPPPPPRERVLYVAESDANPQEDISPAIGAPRYLNRGDRRPGDEGRSPRSWSWPRRLHCGTDHAPTAPKTPQRRSNGDIHAGLHRQQTPCGYRRLSHGGGRNGCEKGGQEGSLLCSVEGGILAKSSRSRRGGRDFRGVRCSPKNSDARWMPILSSGTRSASATGFRPCARAWRTTDERAQANGDQSQQLSCGTWMSAPGCQTGPRSWKGDAGQK
jgi:hypothetical protein